jgi:hypothetical protein
MAIIQVWSAPSCQSGAVCFGALPNWLAATGSESQGTAPAFRCAVSREVADAASLAEGRCLRVLSQSRGEQWWFVTQVTDADGDAGVVQVTAGSLKQLLAVRGFVRTGSIFRFTAGALTPASVLSTYVLTNLADDGLSWLTLGTDEFGIPITIGALDRVTRGGILDAIESATGYSIVLRPVYTGLVLTSFAIDVIRSPGDTLETAMLSSGAQVAGLQRTRDAVRAATVAVPFDTTGRAMDATRWVVNSIIGTAPAWLVLRDANVLAPYPIQENGQAVGAHVVQSDGTATIIADSRASDSAVQVASVGTITAGSEVTIARDTNGRGLVEVTSPSGVAGSRGRLVASVATAVTDARSNLARNGSFAEWTNDTTPFGWTASSVRVGRYPQSTVASETTLVADGALTAGASTITFRGGTVGQRLYRGEFFDIAAIGLNSYIANDVVLIDGAGKGSFTFMNPFGVAQTLGSNVADGAAIGHLTSSTQRPASLPGDTSTALLRLLENNAAGTWYLESAPVAYVYSADAATVNVSAGVTMRSPGGAVPVWTANTQTPRVRIRNLTAGTDLATAVCSVPVAIASTVHQTITASAAIGADASLAVRIFPGEVFIANDNFFTRGFQAIRWVSLWVGSATPPMGPLDGYGSNQLWHRAQQVLAGVAQGTRYTVTGVDLDHLLDAAAPLALGQRVRLRSDRLGVDATVRIVKLDYRFDQTESLSLELGAITPRLTGVTFDL